MLSLVRMCRMCESGMGPPVWPDGGGLLDQPVKLVAAFNFIRGLAPYHEKQQP